MNLIRSVLAAVFAILIASPACCCTAGKAEEPVETRHCCGGTGEEKKQLPDHCACTAKQPKQLEDPPVLPVFTAVELPPVLESSGDVGIPAVPVRDAPPVDFRSDTGPPSRRLAVLQRFLI